MAGLAGFGADGNPGQGASGCAHCHRLAELCQAVHGSAWQCMAVHPAAACSRSELTGLRATACGDRGVPQGDRDGN